MDVSQTRHNSSKSTNSNARCSKPGCNSVLSPHLRSTMCDQCRQKYAGYRITDVPYPATLGGSSAAIQIRSNRLDNTTPAHADGPFITQSSYLQQDQHFLDYRPRPPFSVPGVPSGPQGPPLPLRIRVPPVSAHDPSLFNHFNSKGELINVPLPSQRPSAKLLPNNFHKVLKLEPEAPDQVSRRNVFHSRSVKRESTDFTLHSLSSFKPPLSGVLTENFDLGNVEDVDNLELVYPPDHKLTESLTQSKPTPSSSINHSYSPNPPVTLLSTLNDNGSITIPLPSLPPRPSVPLPRRKAGQPQLPKLRQQGPASAQPSPARNCSTSGCVGVIPDGSTLHRCYSCIMNTWKTKKEGLARSSSNDKGKGKAVSWADQKDASTTSSSSIKLQISNLQHNKSPIKGVLKLSSSSPKSFSSDGLPLQKRSLTKSDCVTHTSLEGGTTTVPVPLPLPVRSRLLIKIGKRPVISDSLNLIDQPTSIAEGPNSESQISSSSCTDVDAGSGLTKDVVEDVEHQAKTQAALTNDEAIPGSSIATGISGWDSELSELSDSLNEGESEGDASDSESEPAPSAPPLIIRIPRRQSLIGDKKSNQTTDPSNIHRCGSRSCSLPLPPGYRWKSCILCRARNREYQRSRQNLQGRHAKLDEELQSAQDPSQEPMNTAESLIVDGDAPNVVPGAQLCSMCARCRKRTRERRLCSEAKASGKPITQPDTESDSEGESLISVYQRLSEVDSALKRCSSRDCGMLLDKDTTSRKCRQCTARISGKVNIKLRTRDAGQPATAGLVTSEVSPFQKYKSLSALLTEFDMRLSTFLEAQTYYFLSKYKEHPDTPREKVVFTFEGEFSVVALDFDLASRKSEIEKSALTIRDHIQRSGSFTFKSQRWVSTLDEGKGFITRFSCVHQVPVIPLPGFLGQVEIPNASKITSMHGELEVDVLIDRSHRFFPGQRTIVRFQSMC